MDSPSHNSARLAQAQRDIKVPLCYFFLSQSLFQRDRFPVPSVEGGGQPFQNMNPSESIFAVPCKVTSFHYLICWITANIKLNFFVFLCVSLSEKNLSRSVFFSISEEHIYFLLTETWERKLEAEARFNWNQVGLKRSAVNDEGDTYIVSVLKIECKRAFFLIVKWKRQKLLL